MVGISDISVKYVKYVKHHHLKVCFFPQKRYNKSQFSILQELNVMVLEGSPDSRVGKHKGLCGQKKGICR